jgi:hypothetical protein
VIKGRFWIKYDYLYTRSERYYEALDTFSNNILRLIFYKIKNIHTLKIRKCSLDYKEMYVSLPKLYLTRRLKQVKPFQRCGRELVEVFRIFHSRINAAVYSRELWCPTHRVTKFTTLFGCSKYTFDIQSPIISCSSKHLLKTVQHKYRHSSSSCENISFPFNCFALKTIIRLLKS